jgi:hypothetical protein
VTTPNKDDTPVTEYVCELKRRDVSAMAKSVDDLNTTFNNFRDVDFNDLRKSVSDVVKEYSDVCNEVGNLNAWKDAHETSHSRGTKLATLLIQGGSWLIALISLVLLLLLQTGIIGAPKP